VNLLAGGKPYDGAATEFAISEKAMNGKICTPKPKTFFVCDLCDLFHEGISWELSFRVLDKINKCPQHQFLILTKRIERFAQQFRPPAPSNPDKNVMFPGALFLWDGIPWPLSNLWLGVSVCVKEELSKIDILRSIPAASREGGTPTGSTHRWVSFGPLLENVGEINLEGIDWVVIEEESDGYRPGRASSNIGYGWHASILPIVEQCRKAGIPVWVKQVHLNGALVKRIEQLPFDVRIREWPNGAGRSEVSASSILSSSDKICRDGDEDNGGCTDA
jgi:protein gp37